MAKSCYFLTDAELEAMYSQGFVRISGPYDDEQSCSDACSDFGMGTSTSSSANICDNVAHWWALDEGSGVIAADSGNSTPAMTGVLLTGVSWTSDTGDGSSYAVEWTSTSYVDLASSEILNNLKAFSVSMLIRRTGENQSGALNSVGSGGWWFGVAGGSESGKIALSTIPTPGPSGDAVYSIGLVQINRWTRITATSDGVSEVKLYIDGVLDSTHTGLTWVASWPGIDPYTISAQAGISVDDVRVYDQLLTDDQVAACLPTPTDTYTANAQLTVAAAILTATATFDAPIYTAGSVDLIVAPAILDATATYADAETGTGTGTASPTSDACWNMNEASGTRADAIGSADMTEVNGSTGSAAGKINDAASIDGGSPAFLQAIDAGLFTVDADTSFAVCFWVKHTSGEGKYIANSGGGWNVYRNSTTEHVYFDMIASVDGGEIIIGDWYFVVAWYEALGGSTGTQYLQINNGTPVSGGTSGAIGSIDSGLNIGGGGFTGLIDEVKWKIGSVWTEAERTALWNSGNGISCP